MFFSRLVGLTNQGVRATATAQIITGDTTDCLKPWAILDRWDEYNTATNGAESEYPNPDPDFLPSSTFDRYSTGQGSSPPQENDLYVRPTPGPTGSPGTGFRLPAGRGPSVRDQSGLEYELDRVARLVPRHSPAAPATVRTAATFIGTTSASCGGLPSSYAAPDTVCPTNIGNDDMAYWAERGCYATEPGNKVGPTRQGIDELLARDPGAVWGAAASRAAHSAPATSSPRVVPIGVMDIDDFLSQDPSGANGVLRMVNIYGFFIEGMGDVNEVTGADDAQIGWSCGHRPNHDHPIDGARAPRRSRIARRSCDPSFSFDKGLLCLLRSPLSARATHGSRNCCAERITLASATWASDLSSLIAG